MPLIRARIKLPLSDTQLKRSCQDLMKIILKIMDGHSVIIQINSALHCYSTRLDIKRLSNCTSQLQDVLEMEGTNRQSSTGKTTTCFGAYDLLIFIALFLTAVTCSTMAAILYIMHTITAWGDVNTSNPPIYPSHRRKKNTLPMDLLLF